MIKLQRRSPFLVVKLGLLALAGAQFVRPKLENPPVTAEIAAPDAVKQVLRRACYDCHSNETRLPWFDQIAPASWLVARDVAEGRKRLNFSELGAQPAARQKAALFESVNHVALGAMPPRAYLALHPGARVDGTEVASLMNYLRSQAPAPAPAAPAEAARAPGAADAPAPPSDGAAGVRPAPNGVEFPAEYARWQPLSGTERFDNGSLRAIVGNERAVRAVAEGRVDPWPDGAALAKVAWAARRVPDGTVEAGDFYQIELMVKDRERYAKTEGWGWGRWRGRDLKPYGEGAGFAAECVGCHAPMRPNDFVFTAPIGRAPRGSPQLNTDAALPDLGPFRPLEGEVLTAFADPQASTFSMLMGNEIAAQHARAGAAGPYPAGSTLALVTWSEVDDARWFGARVPGAAARVDFARLAAATPGAEPAWSHEAFERGTGAAGLVRASGRGPDDRARLDAIVARHAADLPGALRGARRDDKLGRAGPRPGRGNALIAPQQASRPPRIVRTLVLTASMVSPTSQRSRFGYSRVSDPLSELCPGILRSIQPPV
jgi:heme-binding protein/cytochrome P460